MKRRGVARMLPDGRRLHFSDGPIDLIIGCSGAPGEIAAARTAAIGRAAGVLDELCAELALLRRPVEANMPAASGSVARRMQRAVSRHDGFITPMAAVAGAVAEAVLEAMTGAAALDRAYVNNGGDIAVHLAAGASVSVGLVDRPDCPSLFATAALREADRIGGIATSGWRGRSFSLGIADAVTVLAETAADADAAATVIANAVDLPGHPAIARAPARSLDPVSDLGGLPVTREVGGLAPGEVATALASGASVARRLLAAGVIRGAALRLRGVSHVEAEGLEAIRAAA